MSKERTRRLAAVWFADIVGYTALSSRDEDAALTLVDTLQQAARNAVDEVGGRIVKFSGDGVLAVFDSVDAAAQSALALQKLYQAASASVSASAGIRVGLHMGEVVDAPDGDIYGAGVNVAARLQSRAQPGEVVVGRAVADLLRGRASFNVVPVPLWSWLKGVGLTRMFVLLDTVDEESRRAVRSWRRSLHSRPIAVGLMSALATFLGLTIFVASSGSRGEVEVGLSADFDPELRLQLGVEEYFAGEIESAVASLRDFAHPELRDRRETGAALRYLARSHMRLGMPDSARTALAAWLRSEPPMAVLIPTVESDSLMEIYYDVRRAALRSGTLHSREMPVTDLLVFPLQVAGAGDEALPDELGASVAQMIAGDLEGQGVHNRYFWELLMDFEGEGAYRRLDQEIMAEGDHRASHLMVGRVSVSGSEVVVSVQVYELETGTPLAYEQVIGAWPDGLFDLVTELAAKVAVGLGAEAL
ncbi:MAG: adenylate/guanylate cyclase domain-containing protein [Gemmatimonadota bacterium]|nr:adenylate/guanylate cyclase domain-containing protein [Gemmatimonadota bacterium]